ncbi:DUF1109 domain-containing protein [Coralloluteibacterium stylophorae]|uniref:DUF1109 domain-containing protein n=1 Tax=Coralloluteibacterium stylophorae TaxID=1776034 RepID=A0A8J7VQ97_9GAMM|nr:DUF1109 domain-containing protein [Coralloluteibacterium stylophorae]MBS7456871.1 DUF1109 domain-containing protein [Coralloluteibacterium stylophorae]
MKTDDLIQVLAGGTAAVDRHVPTRRFSLALLLGVVSATVLVALLLGVRSDLGDVARLPAFWLRQAFIIAVGAAALWVTLRLSRPGVRVAGGWTMLAVPVAAAWIGAALVLLDAPSEARMPLLLGQTWKVCSALIAMLSLPALAAILWAVRGMAPVRLRLAGAAAGLLAGATAAFAYCLHCPEMAPPFWSTWYLLGMLVPSALGALLGPRALRW